MKEIIENNRNKIRQIIKNFLGEYNEDIEQETYLRTYQNLDKYKELNRFSQWICTICANLCRDYLKSNKRKIFQNSLANNENLTLVSAKDNIEREITLKERQKIVLKEIDKLPKKLKETIILFEFEDYSYTQIANKLKIPEGTVKSRISSARKSLAQSLSVLLKEEIND